MFKKICYIEHKDSFSRNVIDWLKLNTKRDVVVVDANDTKSMKRALRIRAPTVLSPGPRDPANAKATLDLASKLLGNVPLLGICLGHQILAFAQGFKVTQSPYSFHGTRIKIIKKDSSTFLLQDLPESFYAATYNSLVVEGENPLWTTTASDAFGQCQVIENQSLAAFGIQFHPESFLSDDLGSICKRWRRLF